MTPRMKRQSLLITVLAVLAGVNGPTRAQAPAASLTSTPASLTFIWQVGAKLPAAQVAAVRYGSATPAWTPSTPPADPWLIATPSDSALPGNVTVQVNPSTLSPGTYNSSVTVTAVGVVAPLVIPVTLAVSESGTAPSVAPVSVPLTSPGTLTGTFTISAGPLPTTFAAVASVPWLSVNETAGALLPAQSQQLTITANPALLNPSATAYTGKVTVTTTMNGIATSQIVAVSMTVNPLLPTVTSIWPANIPVGSPNTVITIRGSNFYSGTTMTATGQAANLTTTLISSSVMEATLPSTLLATAGVIDVTVTNAAPGGAAAPVAVTVGNVSAISAITNSASYAQGSVSPGEIIAIFGQNIGPSAAATLSISNGYVQTSLGGVGVTIDGIAAPILYVSSQQVSVQVPYTVAAGNQTLILTYGTATPASATVNVAATAPGLFTLNASGAGSALVLNYNAASNSYSVNSSQNPALIGSTVVFFVTGEGDYAGATYTPETGFIVPLTPPVATGVYPELATLPTVSIGGTVATSVTYAGPIPGSMLGLLQINAVVPVGAGAGNAEPLIVTIGTTSTQAGVTMAVK
jgi:trimeric autotransporter adhesin